MPISDGAAVLGVLMFLLGLLLGFIIGGSVNIFRNNDHSAIYGYGYRPRPGKSPGKPPTEGSAVCTP